MSELPSIASQTVDIAIIGGGASGVMVAVQLALQGRSARPPMPSVLLIDPSPEPGRGIAYGTTRPEHVLNVVASRMSILPEQPDHFVRWLIEQGEAGAGLEDRFIARGIYGRYLQDHLRQATQAGIAVARDQVIALEPGESTRLQLASGMTIDARRVVLATGNRARALPLTHDRLPIAEAWDGTALDAIANEDDVAIVGAGLSMVDAVLTLATNGHRARIEVFSRHGLLPLAHDEGHDLAQIDIGAFTELPLRRRLRALRRQVAANRQTWQASMRALRDPGQTLWQTLTAADQRRFLRHAVRYWDIHRHRIAPKVAATLDALRARGQLNLHAARLQSMTAQGGRINLAFIARGETQARSITVDRAINASGIECDPERSDDPLLRNMIANGSARAGPHRRGFDTTDDGRIIAQSGYPQPTIYTLGSPRIGSLWESIAVPDLRVQAAELATRLLEGYSSQPSFPSR